MFKDGINFSTNAMQCTLSMYLWNVIKRFRETEIIITLNNSRVHKLIAWGQQNSTFFSLYLQLIQQQRGPNFDQF